jgi:hypothetical protein
VGQSNVDIKKLVAWFALHLFSGFNSNDFKSCIANSGHFEKHTVQNSFWFSLFLKISRQIHKKTTQNK